MNSMTGYGFKEAVVDNTQISVELRSVNSRFLDLSIILPSFLNPLEARIRKIVSERILRGKVDLVIRVKDMNSTARVSVDSEAAKMYRDALLEICRSLGKNEDEITVELIAKQDGVLNITHEYDAEAYWSKIQGIFTEVLDQFCADRSREGENLKKDLLSKLDILDSAAAFFKDWQPKMEEKFRETVTKKFQDLLGNHVDENKILEEVASLLIRYTINEEIIRLHSHLAALRKEFLENPAPGKRVDFICQEANREINTIGSKNQFTEVGAMVVNAKDALENIREQSKNIE